MNKLIVKLSIFSNIILLGLLLSHCSVDNSKVSSESRANYPPTADYISKSSCIGD